MLCGTKDKYDRRAIRLILAFLKLALDPQFSTINKIQNTDITIRWLNVFLNHLPQQMQALRRSQQILEDLAQKKANSVLLKIAAAMSEIITVLTQTDEANPMIEAVATAIESSLYFLVRYQRMLVSTLVNQEPNPSDVVNMIAYLNTVNRKKNIESHVEKGSIKIQLASLTSEREKIERWDFPIDSQVFYELRTKFYIFTCIRYLTIEFFSKTVGKAVFDALHNLNMKLGIGNEYIWWHVLDEYCLLITVEYKKMFLDNAKHPYDEALLSKHLTDNIKRLLFEYRSAISFYDETVVQNKKMIKSQEAHLDLIKEHIALIRQVINVQKIQIKSTSEDILTSNQVVKPKGLLISDKETHQCEAQPSADLNPYLSEAVASTVENRKRPCRNVNFPDHYLAEKRRKTDLMSNTVLTPSGMNTLTLKPLLNQFATLCDMLLLEVAGREDNKDKKIKEQHSAIKNLEAKIEENRCKIACLRKQKQQMKSIMEDQKKQIEKNQQIQITKKPPVTVEQKEKDIAWQAHPNSPLQTGALFAFNGKEEKKATFPSGSLDRAIDNESKLDVNLM